jgi:hypothetical protein
MIRLVDHRPWARAYGRGGRKLQRAAFEAMRDGDDRRVARPGIKFRKAAGATLIAIVVSAISWALLIALVVLLTHHLARSHGG